MMRLLLISVLVLITAVSLFGFSSVLQLQTASVTALQVTTAQETATPSAIPPASANLQSPLNFTRADYEAAVARWRAQDVSEYEMVVALDTFSAAGGTWRLRIGVHEGAETITQFERVTAGTGLNVGVESLKPLTVGALLRSIERALHEVEVTGDITNPPSNFTPTFYLRATFHPEFGYPTSLESAPNPRSGEEILDADAAITVESLTILQRSTTAPSYGPGMPRTGHPER